MLLRHRFFTISRNKLFIIPVFLFIYFLTTQLNHRFSSKKLEIHQKIAIVMVVTNNTSQWAYDIPIMTIRCYSLIQGYTFIFAVDSDFDCAQKDKFFRRHCVVARILPLFDAILYLDADIGVVNPRRRIEEFLSPSIDITFYDRFYNWEISAGSYLVRNTEFSIDLLNSFADYESKLPRSFHGTDNGALHLYLAERILPDSSIEIGICHEVYNKSRSFADLFSFEACIRSLIGANIDFGKVRIMRKGTGWARDDWLTSGQWNEDLDFMLHGLKSRNIQKTPEKKREPRRMNTSHWYNPLAGRIHLDKCNPSNSTWSYDQRLIGSREAIRNSLNKYRREVAVKQILSIGRIAEILIRK